MGPLRDGRRQVTARGLACAPVWRRHPARSQRQQLLARHVLAENEHPLQTQSLGMDNQTGYSSKTAGLPLDEVFGQHRCRTTSHFVWRTLWMPRA